MTSPAKLSSGHGFLGEASFRLAESAQSSPGRTLLGRILLGRRMEVGMIAEPRVDSFQRRVFRYPLFFGFPRPLSLPYPLEQHFLFGLHVDLVADRASCKL